MAEATKNDRDLAEATKWNQRFTNIQTQLIQSVRASTAPPQQWTEQVAALQKWAEELENAML